MREQDVALLRDTLRRHLPAGVKAFVFGSRARGSARPYSDLDLALEWGRPLGLDIIAELAEALSESDLPYKVDIIDLAIVEPSFAHRIERDAVPMLF